MSACGRRPVVTVGIPFFDEESSLEAAVRSILAQTVTDIEVLLVDDGSTDRSLEIARSFTDERVVVISDGVRRRLPSRLNQIAARASADLVARMDADDVAHPTRLERQLDVLAADPSCHAVGSWVGLMDGAGEPFAVLESAAMPPSPAQALQRGVFAHPTMVARRAWLHDNPYDETLDRAEDRELWCRTVRTSKFVVIPEVLYVLRMSPCRPDFLSDYLSSHQQNRALFLRYGPSSMGLAGTAKSWLTSLGKSLVVRAAVKIGADEYVVRRRGRPPRADELARMHEALDAVRSPAFGDHEARPARQRA
jgi:glycosyltransferase involved in cell wall biosynthesis